METIIVTSAVVVLAAAVTRLLIKLDRLVNRPDPDLIIRPSDHMLDNASVLRELNRKGVLK